MSLMAPLWTRARLTRVMILRYGTNRQGHVNAAAAAADLNVSPRTVQRWLAGTHGRQLAHIPPKRLEQLLQLLTPSDELLETEDAQARNAARAITNLNLPEEIGILPAWKKQNWLDPHLVVILRIKSAGIYQIATTRHTLTARKELRRRGRIVDSTTVPTRFHATLVTHHVLKEVRPWRFRPGPGAVAQGYTQAWLDDAPRIKLDHAAQQIEAH